MHMQKENEMGYRHPARPGKKSLRAIRYERCMACEAAYRAKAAITRPKRPALEAPSLTLEAALVDLLTPVLVPEAEPKVVEASSLLLLLLLEAIEEVSMKQFCGGDWNIHLEPEVEVAVAQVPVAVVAVVPK